MVFSSVPLYLDHPNWHQGYHVSQPNLHGSEDYQVQPPPPPPSQRNVTGASTRPGSMVDQAVVAKIPLPEPGLKCPRCESTNTKFCYFNNYSLSQPRHFCKTCRRYWTRGGALRNVPVGGGCRKNKKIKNKSSRRLPQVMMIKTASTPPSSCTSDAPNHFSTTLQPPPPPLPQRFPFMAALENLAQCGGSSNLGFQSGSNNFSADPWQLPFLAGVEPPGNYDPYQSEAVENGVKMEENHQNRLGLNLFGGVSENNQYLWGGSANTWTEISGLNLTCSTSDLLSP